jgi:hypothetical protein
MASLSRRPWSSYLLLREPHILYALNVFMLNFIWSKIRQYTRQSDIIIQMYIKCWSFFKLVNVFSTLKVSDSHRLWPAWHWTLTVLVTGTCLHSYLYDFIVKQISIKALPSSTMRPCTVSSFYVMTSTVWFKLPVYICLTITIRCHVHTCLWLFVICLSLLLL